jgi:hypothetical protein
MNKALALLALSLISGAVAAQSLQWGIAGHAASLSSTRGAVVMLAGGELGGTGTSTVTATNTGTSTATIPNLGSLIVGAPAPVQQIATGTSNNTTTTTGTVNAGPGSIGGYLGSGVGLSGTQAGQFYTLTTAGPIPTPPVIITTLPVFPTLPTINFPAPF